MKHYFGLGGLCFGAAMVVAAPEVALANPTEVTSIEVRQTPSGMMLMMDTANGDRPQIFLVRRGESIVADLINTKLRLPQGNGYSQRDPSPGIASVVVTPLDSNSTRVVVTGYGTPPNGEIVQEASRGIVLNYSADATAAQSQPSAPPPGIAQRPQANSGVTRPSGTPQRTAQQPRPDVLVPDPTIEIDGVPFEGQQPTVNPAPAFQPRAVAPPVGDIAISSIDTSTYTINLGTSERVPRLVLRDASVEEVLSLLARAAGLNLAYVGNDTNGNRRNQDQEGSGQTITLDVENESVQEVFNNVLRLSGLQANREGNTIVVGRNLPDSARPVISRTLRLNQIPLIDARNFLLSQGAESSDVATQTQTQSVRIDPQDPNSPRITTTTTRTTVELLSVADRGDPYDGYAPLPLRGLLVAIGNRSGDPVFSGNEITLVGDPRKVEMATQMLMQLETRRRQVALNVKIVDVSLNNEEQFTPSFSFGVGDTFISSDGGSAVFNFGGANPPNADTTVGSPITPPIINNPYSGDPFLGDGFFSNDFPASADAPLDNNNDPTDPGITDFTPGETTFEAIPTTVDPVTGEPSGFVLRPVTSPDEYEFSLPSLFQFPTRFLATLQAQVISGNAKILTDPTLVIQEGQTADVNLTQEVVSQITIDFIDTPSGTRESRQVDKEPVGLELAVTVERIDDNGFVTLQVNPSVSAPVGTAGEGEQIVTLIQRRSISSGRIRLRDGQTLILSGIIQDSDRTEVRKVPILGDIPLLGSLFRRTVRDNERQEVIVVLTPNVLDDADPNNFGYTYTPGRDAREILEQQRNFTFPQPGNP
ncbi:AMIN domain-containing protein [Baaleninema sp.]|uniref:AMIN domain-containing protein n=1 Tax=Baaleninema sp. TaxID=3101197 RepID=UPI003D01D1AE